MTSAASGIEPTPSTASEAHVTREVIGLSRDALAASPFFSGLQRGAVPLPALRYIFGQYRFWRDQFHTWFGLCILKSGSCEDPAVAETVAELAEHTVVEMRDDHGRFYREFLLDLGLTEQEIAATAKEDATRRYERSFLDRFGTETSNFFESVIALSGRELFASLRNAHVGGCFAKQYQLKPSRWWSLHEELEVEHFQSVLRPYLRSRPESASTRAKVVALAREEIRHHVDYWDALLAESRELAA